MKIDNFMAALVGGIISSIAIGFKTGSIANGFLGIGLTAIVLSIAEELFSRYKYR
jgi:hypothetical protein